MKDADDPIPVGMISIRDARDKVCRTITPDWQTLEERLNPASPSYEVFQKQDAKCAREEAWGNYDKAQRRAIKWLRDRISQGALVALVRDPKTGDILQLDRDKWASMSDFEIEVTIVMGARQPVFFDRKSFEDEVMKGIAPPDGDRAAHPGESAPEVPNAGSVIRVGPPGSEVVEAGVPVHDADATVHKTTKTRSDLQKRIRAFDDQLRLEGFEGLQKERYEAIRRKFKRRPPHPRTIQRALKSD